MKINKYISITSVLLTLIGCNSNDTSAKIQNSSTPTVSHGYYLDSAVVGANYICGNINSNTDSSGEFKFYKGDSCKFFIDNIELREVESSKLYNGVKIYEDNLPVARILQTLDKDGNPDKNGIELASDSAKCVKETFKSKSIQNEVTDEDIDKLYNCLKSDKSYKGKAATLSEAKAHIERTKGSNDTTPPIISLNGANPLILEAGKNFTDPGATARDDRDGSVTVTISEDVNTSKVGEYTITYSAKDSAGNKANTIRVVKVVDTTPPTISLKGDNPMILTEGSSFNDPGVNTSDNANGEIKVTTSGSVDTNKVGEYSLIYIATDNSGNKVKTTRVIKVIADKNSNTRDFVNDFTISKSSDNIGDIIGNLVEKNSQGSKLTYTIIGDTPFIIDEDGNLIINDSLEVKDYEFDVKISDGENETIRHIVVHSTVNTQSLSEAKESFLKKARAFDDKKSVDDLVNSFLVYANKKAQNDYGLYISKPLDSEVWQFIEDNPTIKEGLYASRFPIDPYVLRNLSDFLAKWKEDGKSDEFIQKYKNVALGLAINAKERGIFEEAVFGDTGDHRVIDYLDIPKVDAKIKRWVEHLDFKNLGFNISLSNFRNLMATKLKLSRSEKNSLTLGASKRLKQAIKDGYSPENMSYKERKKYNISFDEMNLYRLAKGLNRANCNEDSNPCVKINEYIDNENNATINSSYVLEHFQKLKDKIGLINARSDMNDELASKLGILPKDQSSYRLMPFYDLANWKITNDNITAKDFGDDEPNWPLFNISLSKLPWQILALEQNAQKQECQYVKSRFFETDKSKLIDSYPPNAVDGGKKADRRFIQYTTYTWDYDKPEVWFRKSDWTPHRSIYRVLQDGGVCGRQSTMGQHVNECLNRPSIGVGQPGHRAWVGVYLNQENPEQFQTDIGYKVGSRESATPHSNTIYNQYTSSIRATGLERFAGVVAGVSPASGGEHKYNQSMILQHIGKILADEGSNSAETVLKKSVDLVPQNVDAWYQLALYYAKLDKPEKIIALAKDYMQKRDSFFMEPDSRKGAENLEVVTGKNIAFAINRAPSINDGKGDNAQWGLQALYDYLDKYEAEDRSIRSYRDINRYLSNYYLIKEQDSSAFTNEVEKLFKRFVNNTSSGRYDDYFNGVNFEDINKTELFNSLQDITDSAQISDKKRNNIYEKILKRDLTKPLAEINVNDICLDNNLSKCQSVQEFTLNAKAIYILADSKIGEDKEVNPTDRGKEGYSTLTVATTDDLGHDKDIIIRMAKVDTNGKLLKINDPSEVGSDSTRVIAWISPEDNSLDDGRIYTARQRVILKVKKRVTNNEKKMGTVVLDINNLMQGVSRVINKTEFTSETIKENNSSIYFVTLKDNIGPIKGVWWKKGYTTLKIPVVDNSGNKYTMKLRAYNDDDYKMNSGLSADWDNTLSIKYLSKDNPDLVSAKEYKTVKPFTIDAKMWHKDDKLKIRYYFKVDLTVP